MKTTAMNKDDLNDLVGKSHPYIKDVVKIYGEQGCDIGVCPKCLMLTYIHAPIGKVVSGPSLSSLMYCQHREE